MPHTPVLGVQVVNPNSIILKIRVGKRFTITILKEIREKMNIKEGDELDLLFTDDGIILRNPMSLVEFIDNIKPIGSVKTFLEERGKERIIENERVRELTK